MNLQEQISPEELKRKFIKEGKFTSQQTDNFTMSVYYSVKLVELDIYKDKHLLTTPEDLRQSILYMLNKDAIKITTLQDEINRLKDVEKEYLSLKAALKTAIQD